MATISIRRIEKSGLETLDLSNLDFGKVFCDHMFIAKCENGIWGDSEILPYGPLSLSPASSVFHYGQAVFEGMKAYRSVDGDVQFFRLLDNFKRFNLSSKRMAIPEVPQDIFVGGLKALVEMDKGWIPPHRESALYLRPFIIAVDEFIGVKPANNYWFIIINCAVNAYYNKTLKLKIEENFVRAVKGGVGEAKASGNYAAAMFATQQAQKEGYDQILWTDAKHHKWVEELGTSNFFCVIDQKIITPLPEGTILRGVTRDSVLQLAKHLGYDVEERPLSVDELVGAAKSGALTEAFATGTAAALTAIESISYRGDEYKLAQTDTFRKPIAEALLQIRIGEMKDPFNWVQKLDYQEEAM
jgi:branched-chain amino acid aminotransferase